MWIDDVLEVLENSFKVAAVIGLRSRVGSGGVDGGAGTLTFGTVSISRTSCTGLGISDLTSLTPCVSIYFVAGLVGMFASFCTVGPAPESCRSSLGLVFGLCSP